MPALSQHHAHKLESSRGGGMHVAVIDSGLGKSLEDIAVGEVIDLTGSKGGPQEGIDEIGHGTACMDLIARVAPEATISSIKVFGEELRAHPEVILQALGQCKELGVHVINLSLGTLERDWEDELYAVCRDLSDAGILLVSANRDPALLSSPAKFDCVYGVNGGRVRGKYGYFYDSDAVVQFIARGDRQRVVWQEGRKALIAASSFAAARVSGIVLLLEQRRRVQGGLIEEQFHRFSAETAPPMVHQSGNEAGPTSISGVGIRGKESIKPDLGWIGRAAVYPFNKEMRSLVRFADQLSFEIASVVDIPPSKLKGLDAGEAIGAEPVGASVRLVLEEALDGVDTLIIGHLDAYSEAKRKDLVQEALEVCLVKGCNVYSLSRTCLLYEVPYAELFEKRGLRLAAPVVDKAVYRALVHTFAPNEPITCPVLGIFGTSQDQGKVTAQLLIRKELKRRGYATSWLATEHQGELLGADYTFPNGYEGLVSVDIPMESHVTLLQSAMVGIAQSAPDIVLNSAFFALPAILGCGVDPEADCPVQQAGSSPFKMDLREEGTLVLRAEDGKKLVSATHVLPNGNGTLVVADKKSGNVVEVTADGLVIDEYRHLEGEGRNFTKPKYLIWTPSGGLIVLDSRYAYEFDKDKKYVEKRPWWYVERMENNSAGRYAKLVSRGRFLFRVGPTEDGEHGLLATGNMSLRRKYGTKGLVLKGDSLVVTTNLDNTLRVYDINEGQLIGKYLVDERQVSNDLFSEVDSKRDPRFVEEWSNAAHLLDLYYLQEVGLYIVLVVAPETEEMREEGEEFGYYLVYDDQFRRVGRIDFDYGWLVGTADEGLLYMRQGAYIDDSGNLADPVVKVYRIAVSDA